MMVFHIGWRVVNMVEVRLQSQTNLKKREGSLPVHANTPNLHLHTSPGTAKDWENLEAAFHPLLQMLMSLNTASKVSSQLLQCRALNAELCK